MFFGHNCYIFLISSKLKKFVKELEPFPTTFVSYFSPCDEFNYFDFTDIGMSANIYIRIWALQFSTTFVYTSDELLFLVIVLRMPHILQAYFQHMKQ